MSSTKKKYGNLLRQTPVGCLVLEQDSVVALNPEAVETLDIPSGKIIGVPLVELLLPEFEERCDRLIAEADDKTRRTHVRLARAAAPIELSARKIDKDVVAVAVRSLEQETYYSAAAKGELTHDQVTGLPNRYFMFSELERYLATSTARPLSVVAVWIDELQSLENERGDSVCERILTEVGGRLETKLRGPDLLGRFDSTGFMTLLRSDVTVDQLAEIGDRLRDEIAFPVEFDGKLVSFTTSLAIGTIEETRPSAGRITALLEAAANRATSSGGDRTEVVRF